MVIRLEGSAKASSPDTTQMSYGLGWIIQDYRGRLHLSHGGHLEGFRSRIVLVPKARLGIGLLMNADAGTRPTSMHLAATNNLLDLLLKLPKKDWQAYYLAQDKKQADETRAREAARAASRRKGTRPSRKLQAYEGTYEEPAYGRAVISLKDGTLRLRWSSGKARLEHFHFDTFTARGDTFLANYQAVFHLGADGEVATMDFLGVTFKKIRP
jgi:hypothetical protein